MVDLKKDVKYVKGVGPNRVKLLNRLNIYTLEDLITYFPREHEDRSIPRYISEVADGEEVLIKAIVVSRMSEIRVRRGMTMYKLVVRDETGTCTITWFNQSYLKNRFKTGNTYLFYGKVHNKFGKIEMNNPVYDDDGSTRNTGKIIPLYPLTYELTQNVIRKIIENALKEVDDLEETLPDYIVNKYNVCDYNSAIHKIHFPDNFEEYNKARKRLVFEELLSMQLALLNLKNKYHIEENRNCF